MNDDIKDVIMVGAGPSSLTAAIYTTREDLKTVLYERASVGGMMAITDRVDNYPGFPEGIGGYEAAEKFQAQAKRFGAEIEYGEITAIKTDGDLKVVTVDGKDIKTRTVLIASGAGYNKLGIPGESEYYGRGVHYCATCDGAFYRDKRLVVVGGGNSAIQEAIFLTRFASHIDLLVRSKIRASDVLKRELQEMVNSSKITVHLEAIPDKIVTKEDHVVAVEVTEKEEQKNIETDGVFIFVGLKPNSQFLENSGIELDEYGFIKTDENLQTNIPGVFASGDVRSGSTMQVASAVGEGAAAAISIREYLQEHKLS